MTVYGEITDHEHVGGARFVTEATPTALVDFDLAVVGSGVWLMDVLLVVWCGPGWFGVREQRGICVLIRSSSSLMSHDSSFAPREALNTN